MRTTALSPGPPGGRPVAGFAAFQVDSQKLEAAAGDHDHLRAGVFCPGRVHGHGRPGHMGYRRQRLAGPQLRAHHDLFKPGNGLRIGRRSGPDAHLHMPGSGLPDGRFRLHNGACQQQPQGNPLTLRHDSPLHHAAGNSRLRRHIDCGTARRSCTPRRPCCGHWPGFFLTWSAPVASDACRSGGAVSYDILPRSVAAPL